MSQQAKDPTPEQIRERTAEIRAGWSAEEHHRRLRADLRPSFTLADGRQATIGSDDYEQHLEHHQRLQASG